jgi:DNA polymerase-3 subunit beta
VGARKLIDILRTMPADQTVSLESSQAKLILKGGKSKFTLQTLPAKTFRWCRRRPDFGPLQRAAEDAQDLLGQVSFAMAVHDIRYYLNGILFVAEGKQLSLVATDGHRLALPAPRWTSKCPSRKSSCRARPCWSCSACWSDAEGAIEMQFANNQAKFSFGGMEFVTKLVEGKFPDYNRVIPKNHKNSVTLGRAPLLASLQRTAILTSDKFKGVRLNIDPGTLRVASNNAEQEEAGGRARHRLRRRQHRDRLQRHLPDRRAGQHEPGHGEDRAAGRQQLGAVHHSRQRHFKYVVMPMRI